MDEEEQFVNIDLNDDNICSVCKLETETGTLSFCHVCFELSIEGKKWDSVVQLAHFFSEDKKNNKGKCNLSFFNLGVTP